MGGAAESGAGEDPAALRRRSIFGLNALNFCVADMLTGFGPFVTVYLTAAGWQPSDIGIALTVGTASAIAGQVPAGMLVDAVPYRRLITAVGLVAVIASALILALFSTRWTVFGAELLQGFAASMLTPAIAAITLTLSHSDKLGERLGGNVRFKALGSMLAALLMGYVGNRLGPNVVFFVAAAFGVAALGCLFLISGVDIIGAPHRTEHQSAWPRHARREPPRRHREFWRDPALLTFAVCAFMFQLGNAAVLPFGISAIQRSGITHTDTLVSIALIVSQGVTAALSPWLGRTAQSRGRKFILLAGFAALALRGVLYSIYSSQTAIVAYQVLDGISAAAIGVMVPLIVADLTHRGDRFNLAMGLVGLAMTGGAALSTLVAGFLTQHLGVTATFLALAGASGAGFALVLLVLPETGHLSRTKTAMEPAPHAA